MALLRRIKCIFTKVFCYRTHWYDSQEFWVSYYLHPTGQHASATALHDLHISI